MRIPLATYRLQLSRDLTFQGAADLVPYLAELGISDLYVSPIFTARAGSDHGYDVLDHGHLNPELGGDEGFERLAEALRRHGLGLLLDVVPNHMCIAGTMNRRWMDVLEDGPSSPAARFFDIDWRPPKAELVGKVLLPVLAKQYGQALEEDLEVVFQDGRFGLAFDGNRLPLDPRTWGHVLEPALEHMRRRFGDEEPNILELESIIRALTHLPSRTDINPARVRERLHEKEVIRRRLIALVDNSADVRAALHDSLQLVNGRKGDPSSFDRLEALVAAQGYRLSLWRVAAHEINYRRFFDINDLAAIRVEDPAVFTAVHELPLRLVARKVATGLRIDHVDGLSDPERYLQDLRQAWVNASDSAAEEGGFVVLEKILMPGERLPPSWATAGTTGYDFANLVTGVLINAAAGDHLKAIATRFTGEPQRFQDVVYEGKKLVLRAALSSELTVLARKLDRISEQHRYSRDFTLNSLHEVLSEIIACFPVYRTYVRPTEGYVSDRDRAAIESAIRLAKRRNPVINESLFDFVRSLLLLDHPPGLAEPQREERRDFVRRFQQITGPVMAKGVEDTAFYRYFPLAAVCEVGGDPSRIGLSIEELHRSNAERLRTFPHALSGTATHDTKRGEDTRARLVVLSELPEEWEMALGRFREANHRFKTDMGGWEAPSAADEMLLYQTLVGTWPRPGVHEPGYAARVRAYMVKAVQEAKVHTSWVNPDSEYVNAVNRFVAAVLVNREFVVELERLVARVSGPGYLNGLTQVLLKIASPGVPDFYQGTELWDFSLVDPDNRRRVDFAKRRALLETIHGTPEERVPALAAELLASPEDGRIKLLVTARALDVRRRRRAVFDQGRYDPLTTVGVHADHAIAFARVLGDAGVLAVCGRHHVSLGGDAAAPVGAVWRDTRVLLPEPLAQRSFRDVLTGQVLSASGGSTGPSLPLANVFAHLPVALLDLV